ncbi:MAG: DUF1801 domain-containing protein [Eubacteriales bacterium]|jgi:uncharacterized protein YdhG (YjbR/CyaY superfamily)|nr:DUF1801 domain-containing protein [Eubacteriales bacterium]MDD3866172.1 DUF1801 domain-containing protein [Eubacteriales bacterium]MDD4461857.1 DUF1801 domain-containing protein [Eubacteriales bacterium]
MWQCPNCKRTFRNDHQAHYCGESIASIDDYISEQDAAIQPILRQVHQSIRAVLPEAEERIAWRMPTYWQGHNIIHFAAFKHHMGLYPGPEAIVAFSERLAPYRTSKGAIQFRYEQPVPLDLIADLAKWCLETGHHH